MPEPGKDAGTQQAPVTQEEESFGMNDEDFYVDENTGAIFIGDTAIVGQGRRPQQEKTSMLGPPRDERIPDELKYATRDEEFKMDEDGNLDIGDIRVKEEGIDNIDPVSAEFERGRKSGDELEQERLALLEKQRQEQKEKEPTPETPPKEWRLKVADEERVIKDETELMRLAQKGLGADYRFQEIAKMRKAIEPFYEISLRLKDDPGFVEHVKNYGQPHYQVEGPEPMAVTPEQFQKLVEERVDNQVIAKRIYWQHDKKYENFNGYPSSDEVRQKLHADSLHWDKFTRDWVDKNPVAYADKFQQAANTLIKERMLDPDPAIPIPPRVIEKQRAVLEKLKAKEAAKERAKVESAKSAAEISASDGRLRYNRARKRAQETGDIADWAAVIAEMGIEE